MRIARLVVAFALAVLVPLQGLAAMTAGLCMAMGHHEMPHEHAGHHGDPNHEGHEHDGGGSGAHCAPCVACCAAACIPSAVPVFLPHPLPLAALGALPAAPTGFVPERFYRPPLAL